MNKDDGGSAFPNAPLYGLEENNGVYELLVDEQGSGMTLRDYFAAKALQSLISIYEPEGQDRCIPNCARDAYSFADAMLKERET